MGRGAEAVRISCGDAVAPESAPSYPSNLTDQNAWEFRTMQDMPLSSKAWDVSLESLGSPTELRLLQKKPGSARGPSNSIGGGVRVLLVTRIAFRLTPHAIDRSPRRRLPQLPRRRRRPILHLTLHRTYCCCIAVGSRSLDRNNAAVGSSTLGRTGGVPSAVAAALRSPAAQPGRASFTVPAAVRCRCIRFLQRDASFSPRL